MVAAREFDDFVSSCDTTGDANGAHGRFGAAAYESHTLHARNSSDDEFREMRLHFGWRSERSSSRGSLADSVDHLGVGMAEDHRPPGADVIDVAIAIDIKKVLCFCTLDKERGATHCTKSPGGRVYATGNQLTGALKCPKTLFSVHYGYRLWMIFVFLFAVQICSSDLYTGRRSSCSLPAHDHIRFDDSAGFFQIRTSFSHVEADRMKLITG